MSVWSGSAADRLLAMCMKETTMGETLNGKPDGQPGRWVRATVELRGAMKAGDKFRLCNDRMPYSVTDPNWQGWDALDYDIWIPDPVPTVLDRVKAFETRSPGIFARKAGRTTAAIYRACERVVTGESLVYVVGNQYQADEVTEMARQFFTEEFKAKFHYRKHFGDFIVTYRVTPGTWGPREHKSVLVVRVCATVKDYEELRYGYGDGKEAAAFANDHGEWAAERLRQAQKITEQLAEAEARIKSVGAQYDTQEKEALTLRGQLKDSEKRNAELTAYLETVRMTLEALAQKLNAKAVCSGDGESYARNAPHY